MTDAPQPCPNCDEPAAGPYCAACGARTSVPPLTLRSVVTDAAHQVLDLELPLLRTARDLCIRPGRVASEWIAGRRREYSNPIKFCLLTGVFAAMIALLISQFGIQSTVNVPTADGSSDGSLIDYLAFLSMAITIPLAVVMSVLGRLVGIRRRTLDWYVLLLYVYGMTVVAQMSAAAVSPWVPWIDNIDNILPLVWFSWGAWGIVDRGQRWLSLGLSIVGQIVWILLLVVGGQAFAVITGAS